ncbi:MAG: cysteine synthase A [Spirochaetes bacterium]|uniref:Cysteine synthase n=1 Tax=Candidatus Gallitreponema excrementavium TaxID=2840840 RepID=A0A9D9HQN6_9SPIR|nr:cysteine synthase A [Candidatus Gallitreponema excrementavium]
MKIAENITELVGGTPLLEMKRLEQKNQSSCRILAKLEYFNPAGSAKDRIAREIILSGLKDGSLTRESVVIEPTSGNTGIALAAIAASLGMRAIFTMPETMSLERRKLLQAYGAEIVLTEGSLGMSGAIKKAESLAGEISGAFMPSQFTNPLNPMAHYKTTGPEIWEDTEGNVGIFIAGIGTGGTVSGTGKYLKEQNPEIKVIGVEPAGSPVITRGNAGSHKIQGIGAGFVPETLDKSILDEVICISDESAFNMAREASREGILVGISSGAALAAAETVANRKENKGKTIVVLLPDTGERYLSCF